MSRLNDAILQVQTIVSGITGINSAPLYPPENVGTFPFCTTHASSGYWGFGPGGGIKGMHTIVIEIHIARKDLPLDVQVTMPFGDLVAEVLLADPTLGGTVSTFGRLSYTYGAMAWGELLTIGWRISLEEVKIL